MSRKKDTTHVTIPAEGVERFVQFIDQADGRVEVIVFDGEVIETRVIVDQLDLLHAIELVAS